MPRINDHILDNTFYLYKTQEDAKNGTGGGGCGLFIFIRFEATIDGLTGIHAYAVTNKHVIEEMSNLKENKGPVIRVNTVDDDNDPATLETSYSSWIPHQYGHDLAAHPIPIQFGYHKVLPLSFHQLLTKDKAKELDVGVGHEVITVGRFKTHEGKQRNTPVARFGHISMMPFEPIYNSYLQMPQESFLVECHSASGNSGAPVLVQLRPSGGSSFLLGIVWAHMDEYVSVLDLQGEPIDPSWRVKYNTGMMAVIPAWRIIELLETEDFIEQRKQVELRAVEKYLAQKDSSLSDLDVENNSLDG